MKSQELEDRLNQEMYEFVRDAGKAERAYESLYEKYYKTGQQITNQQRAEVREAYIDYDSRYGKEKEEEMLARHEREREEYNAEAYLKWTKLEGKRSDLIKQYGSVDEIPKAVWEEHKNEIREYDAEWGANGQQIKALQEEHNYDEDIRMKRYIEYMEKEGLPPYQRTIRRHMKERVEFNGKVADNWKQQEEYRESLVKEYQGWSNVPQYQKDLYDFHKSEFEREWGEAGKQKEAMIQRHRDEIAEQMKEETARFRNRERDRDRGIERD